MTYDTMSVHDLTLAFAEYVRVAVAYWKGIDQQKVEEYESALRRTVIKEASVGTMNYYLKTISEHPLFVKKRVEIFPDDLLLGLYNLIPQKNNGNH
jgi:hypothetical protein